MSDSVRFHPFPPDSVRNRRAASFQRAARPAMRPAIGFLPGYRAASANSFRMVLAVLIVTLSLMLEPAVFIQLVFA